MGKRSRHGNAEVDAISAENANDASAEETKCQNCMCFPVIKVDNRRLRLLFQDTVFGVSQIQ
jgi:hypothetical protein